MKRRTFRHVREHGCELLREGRSRSWWTRPTDGSRSAIPRHPELVDKLPAKNPGAPRLAESGAEARGWIGDLEALRSETGPWATDVNERQRGMDWQMTVAYARCGRKTVSPNIVLSRTLDLRDPRPVSSRAQPTRKLCEN